MNCAPRNFLLLGEDPVLLVQALRALRAAGPSECIVVLPRDVRRFGLTNLVSCVIHADLSGAEDEIVLTLANQLAATRLGLTLVPCDCTAERLVNRHRDRLAAALMPMPDPDTLACFDDKWRFYNLCRQLGLPVPTTLLLPSKHELAFTEVADTLGLPFVVKPVNAAGSAGFQVISSKEEYEVKLLGDSRYQYAPLLAQRFVRGPDLSLNMLAVEGRIAAVAVQQREPPQHFGAPIRFISSLALEQAGQSLCRHSDYNGLIQIDARLEEATGKVFLFEANARVWGSLTASAWCGLNFLQACVERQDASKVLRLDSGCAPSMHYHPLFQPLLCRALLSPHVHRRRLARAMVLDMWTLQVQSRSVWRRLSRRWKSDQLANPGEIRSAASSRMPLG